MTQLQTEQPQSLPRFGLIYPHAAGLDVGSMNMVVSYSTHDGSQRVKEYGAFTSDLQLLATELAEAGVTHLAMEATGVYWIAAYEVLEQKGVQVTLINARHYKNVAAHKTDVQDCQWIHQLQAHGLLRSSHIAEEGMRELRTYIHERGVLQQNKTSTLNRIHKVLTQMNIKLQHVLSDIEGVAGMQILRRLAAGVSGVEDLLSGVNTGRLKASREVLEQSLSGLFKPHYQKVLQGHLACYNFYKEQMLHYEQLIEEVLTRLLPPAGEPVVRAKTTKARKNQYHFNLREYLHQIVGVDLTEVDGLDEAAVLSIIAVVGLNMHKWPTAQHFISWLNLSARPCKSGGKVLGHQKRFTRNAATQAFRMAAQTMWQSKSSLGALYRRLSSSKGSKKAIKAVAARIAVIFYNMVKKQTAYDPKIVVMDEQKIKAKKIARLKKEAEKLGCRVETIAA